MMRLSNTLTSVLSLMYVHNQKYNSTGFIKSTDLRKNYLEINNKKRTLEYLKSHRIDYIIQGRPTAIKQYQCL